MRTEIVDGPEYWRLDVFTGRTTGWALYLWRRTLARPWRWRAGFARREYTGWHVDIGPLELVRYQ